MMRWILHKTQKVFVASIFRPLLAGINSFHRASRKTKQKSNNGFYLARQQDDEMEKMDFP